MVSTGSDASVITHNDLGYTPNTEAEIEWAKDLYYRMAGWDAETGNPTLERLEELGIAWAMG